MENVNQIWIDIIDFNNYYVSNNGEVKSVHSGKERILKKKIDRYGYYCVGLSKNGKIYWRTVHRLVAQAFIQNPDNLPCVNHKDENKQNNFVWINDDGSVDFDKSNLEWCSHRYNTRYSQTIPILQFDLQGNLIKEWECITDASTSLNIDRKTICAICKHKKHFHSAKGFTFQYKYQCV